MLNLGRTMIFFIWFFSTLTTIYSEEPLQCSTKSSIPRKQYCTIYMAPSSIKGIDGMGLFTIEDMKKGQEFLSSYDGPSIPILNFKFIGRGEDSLSEDRERWIKLFDGYWWGRSVPDHTSYEADKVIDFQITFGALPNHHCELDSIAHQFPNPGYDDTLLDPYSSPGLGAISYHNGRSFYAEKRLVGGSELLLNYGYCKRSKKHPVWANSIPMKDDFLDAVSEFVRIWDSVEGDYVDTEKIQRIISHYRSDIENPLIQNLLPETTAQFLQVIDGLNRWNTSELIRRLASWIGSTPRTPEWIQKNGICIENLVPGPSLIQDAGRGAFAQFDIKQGQIVVPVPTLQIINRDVLMMADPETLETSTMQLLLNYCFGHSQSTLLLCPLTNAILINHCSTRNPNVACPHGPNAKVQWASSWDKTNGEWLQMTFEELRNQKSRGLSMEIVAIRDISVGDEVFIDYGTEWEIAWEQHVRNWEAPTRPRRFMTAAEANANSKEALEEFLTHDLRKSTDHPNLYSACFFPYTSMNYANITTEKHKDWWMNLSDNDLLSTYASDGSRFVSDYKSHDDDSHWRCHVIYPDGEDSYTVRVVVARRHVPLFLTAFPRDSIHFFHEKHGSDQHLTSAFRHHVGMPDDMFPNEWRNHPGETEI